MNLNKYLIAEEGFAAGGIAILVASILGLKALSVAYKKKDKKQQKARRADIDKWFIAKGIEPTDEAIKTFLTDKIQSIGNDAIKYLNSVYRNSSFKKKFEASIKEEVEKIHSEYTDDEDLFSDRLKWSVYKPNCMVLKPEFLKSNGNIQVGLIDKNSKLFSDIMSFEDQDDNAPEFLKQILSPTLDEVGSMIVTKLKTQYKELTDTGLITIEYHDSWESFFDLIPEINISALHITSSDGKRCLFN